jgi:hypothetical protein
MTMARAATTLPWHTSLTRSFTKSQDLSLLSIARLNKASSRDVFRSAGGHESPRYPSASEGLLADKFPFVPRDVLRCGVTELIHDGLPFCE